MSFLSWVLTQAMGMFLAVWSATALFAAASRIIKAPFKDD